MQHYLYLSMPLLKEWNNDDYSLGAIWHIEEPEEFFTAHTGIRADVRNDKRRLEHAAGRFLLRHLIADFPVHDIAPDLEDKPQLPDYQYHFSISHSFPYVAAVVSPYQSVGIDIQCWHPRIQKIQSKFLSDTEQRFCQNDEKKITAAWSAKEAVYKWAGKRGVDFKVDMPILEWEESERQIRMLINQHILGKIGPIAVKSFIFNDFSLSYVSYDGNLK